jgi:uncharacterized ubiquitin-like protein YukD
MEGKIKLTLRTATRDRQSDLSAPTDVTIGELIASAKENWNLSGNYEYILRSEKLGVQLQESQTLEQAGIPDGDVLEIAGLSDAGSLI